MSAADVLDALSRAQLSAHPIIRFAHAGVVVPKGTKSFNPGYCSED
jgi:hypothetical protein